MKRFYAVFAITVLSLAARPQTVDPGKYPAYSGNDLGLTYTPKHSFFRIWSPPASAAEIVFFSDGDKGNAVQRVSMEKSKDGTWTADVAGDRKGQFYAFRVLIDGKWSNEVPDPYAKAAGVNGKRAMVVDLAETNPPGWANDRSPRLANATDAIIYELHIRDASIASGSGMKHKGKFLALTETGTKNPTGMSTGLDHLKELGVTHIHLLPFFDFHSVDETRLTTPQYNWGYDPLNYNIPEGSYSTDPFDGNVRIREFKQLVRAFHEKGLSVVMDVVYNHTGLSQNSNFNELVPGYYYRQNADGKWSDATACGNETASERAMMRKFMLESVKYWVKEYHIDGFRFDLMGVHDISTMNLISRELRAIRPDILLYGEGWTAGASPLPDSLRALKVNVAKMENIAVFSDDIRDGIKGSVFEHGDRGFASGKPGMEETIKFGIAASCRHPQINYSKVNYSRAPYASKPSQVITYAECHDNHVLWDKLAISCPDATIDQRKEMHKLALSLVLTSQGISFLHAGTEFLRSKKGIENSYNAGDSINAIDWNLKTANNDVFQYVKALISLRKAHPAFRMTRSADIAANIRFGRDEAGLVSYTINGTAVKDSWNTILVVLNGKAGLSPFVLPPGNWTQAIRDNRWTGKDGKTVSGTINIAAYSCNLYYR